MSKQLTITFTTISGICCIILVTICIRYFFVICHNQYNGKPLHVDPLIKKYATISLFGYTLFVLIAFILDLIASLWYIPFININYTKILCQLQAFNIAFFMIGKLAMYFFFMVLVHVSFKGSFLAYPPRILGFLAISFFIIMCIIGAFYMMFLFLDFNAVESLSTPNHCLEFTVSTRTSIVIWTGATFDALWSFTCLLLFCLRLRMLTNIMERQKKMSRKNVLEMEKKYNPEFEGDSTTNSNNTLTKDTSGATPTPTIDATLTNRTDVQTVNKTLSDSNDTETDSLKTQKHKQRQSRSGRSSIMDSLQTKVKTIRLRVKKKKKKQPSIVQKFLPVMLKLTILSTWSALSTVILGFSLWTLYPSISSVIDSTINAICVYLSFGFVRDLYEMLCLPFISCKRCMECMTVINEVHRLEKTNVYDRNEHSVLG